jgi:pyruvate dehydrogenase E2 component (dihydrolipoamide acetyltransferase)
MEVKLPKLGEGAESGTVVSVLVKEGEQVQQGQTIVELENEKAVAPIPSSASGVVQSIRVKVGDTLSVGQVILTISEEGVSPDSPVSQLPPVSREETSLSPGQSEGATEEPVLAAPEGWSAKQVSALAKEPVAPPSIRKLARELGIDLARVTGSGPGGRIAMPDVRAYILRLQKFAFPDKTIKASPIPPSPVESVDFSKWGPIETQHLSPLRQTISRRLVENWNSIPHVTQFEEVDITSLNQLRKSHAPAYEAKGAKLTLTVFALRAVVSTLQKHPLFNASLDETRQSVVVKKYYHIGLAVDTEQGLFVPVLRDVDKKSLLELAQEVNELAERARTRKLTLEEMKGGTFTISNQGGIGSGFFTPIINRPEVAILGLGRALLKPVLLDGQIVPRLLMPAGLSYDHRLIDGASAARFMVDLGEAFQNFPENEMTL